MKEVEIKAEEYTGEVPSGPSGEIILDTTGPSANVDTYTIEGFDYSAAQYSKPETNWDLVFCNTLLIGCVIILVFIIISQLKELK